MSNRVRDCADWLMCTAFVLALAYFFFHAVRHWHWSELWLLASGALLLQTGIFGLCAVRQRSVPLRTDSTHVSTHPQLDAWYVEDMLDGCAHYGYYSRHYGTVDAICGARFTPLYHPTTKKVVVYTQLKDVGHGCRQCRGLAPAEALGYCERQR